MSAELFNINDIPSELRPFIDEKAVRADASEAAASEAAASEAAASEAAAWGAAYHAQRDELLRLLREAPVPEGVTR